VLNTWLQYRANIVIQKLA